MSLYEGSVKKPIMTSLIFVAVVILGLFSLKKLPVDLLPDIETNTIIVMTSYSGASAVDIETNITKVLENTLNTVSNLKHITSSSKENISLITLEFEYGLDIDVLTNDVRDKLELVKSYLPEGSTTPIIFKFSTDMIPIVMISATADKSMTSLYKTLDDKIANPLARINGVGSVSIAGVADREVQVYVDPVKLEAYNLSVESISQIIGAENRSTPAGSFDIGSNTYSLRVEGEFKSPSELNNIVVSNKNGKTVYLKDIAIVKDTIEERAQETYTNGKQGASIIVQKQTGANSVEIAEAIKEALPKLQKDLPSDVKIEIFYDTSENINNTIDSLVETVLLAFLFVMVVVLFFLGRWRATIIIIITIPISLIGAFIYLAVTGGSLNIITLSSLTIAIGMVVDDAIVVLENVTTHIERGSDPKNAAIHGTNEVAVSVIASTLTLIAVFFPLTLITGMTGVLFAQLGWMVCIIMTISVICSLTLTPMLCAKMLRLNPKRSKAFSYFYAPIERLLDNIDNGYASMLNWCVRNRKKFIVVTFAFFFLSLFVTAFLGTGFFPSQDSAVASAQIKLPIGSRIDEARDLAKKINAEWREEYPEMKVINFSVGQASSDNVWGSLSDNGNHIINYNITLTDPGDRKRDLFEITDMMREDLRAYPEIVTSTVTAGRGGSMGGQSTLDVEIYGYDFEKTDAIAKELINRMSNIKGLSNLKSSRDEYAPEYQVDFDREKLALQGLNISTASNYLRNRINGATASQYKEDGDEYAIKVRYAPEFRQSIESIEDILIYNNQGKGIRVKELGKVVERSTPPSIQRKDRERVITVSGTISGEAMDKIISATNKEIAQMDIPSDITLQIGGSYEDQQDSFADLGLLALIIVMLVFIVMAAEFESITYPFIMMMSVPFAISGVIIGLAITGVEFNVMSAIGAIMLIGIVVKNGIVMVDYINLNRERGDGIIYGVVSGGKSRLRPVVMTTLTTILGMLPMALKIGQGSEMWQPMGVAVIGGLTLSTIVTLFLIPVLYAVFASNGIKRKRKKNAELYAKKQK